MYRPFLLCTRLFCTLVLSVPATTWAERPWLALGDEEPYALDHLPRSVGAYHDHRCPQIQTLTYAGRWARYQPEATVNTAFVAKVEAMEAMVAQLGQVFYGRPPSHIILMSSYQCRRVREGQRNISEHALGNALDIAGFIFPAVDPKELPTGAPLELALPQRITVLKHWKGSDALTQLHQLFLRTWVQQLIDKGLFRVVLGPGHPGHHNHIHVDQAPYRLVSVAR